MTGVQTCALPISLFLDANFVLSMIKDSPSSKAHFAAVMASSSDFMRSIGCDQQLYLNRSAPSDVFSTCNVPIT